eukprot:CAMPEP_0204367908 /NCGR_PEP_ID=MMETSP0469-20131031/43790_1 /ASSEMBLY_ACC=CAM_ASM_000384 /TAXON_ID=2969 /ORGANISM="Oxyrrhis marina" /LENGTH=803 /DNA_ID=CAMNT_0051357385 /DNA_START=1 /DNA_END=2412 /DNA_ORIENTATION=+
MSATRSVPAGSTGVAHPGKRSEAPAAAIVQPEEVFRAAVASTRSRLAKMMEESNAFIVSRGYKRAYVLSLEYSFGRQFEKVITDLEAEEEYRDAIESFGSKQDMVFSVEPDCVSYSNCGLAAAALLDAAASANLPVQGFGLRLQTERDEASEAPGSDPWEVKSDQQHRVHFGGRTEMYNDDCGHMRVRWVACDTAVATAQDTAVTGCGTTHVVPFRRWMAECAEEISFQDFSEARVLRALEVAQWMRDINTSGSDSAEMRLRQQYFFCSASIQDILHSYRAEHPQGAWTTMPEMICIQLYESQTALAIPELMRLLVDVEMLPWDEAWAVVSKLFFYTAFSVQAEAQNRCPVEVMRRVLPRHLQIIEEINHRFLDDARRVWGDVPKTWQLSLFEEGSVKRVRMDHLAVLASGKVTGVSELHSDLVRDRLFQGFHHWAGEHDNWYKFTTITSGASPRFWLHCANPPLSQLITQAVGCDEWLTEFGRLDQLREWEADAGFQEDWWSVKNLAKKRVADWVRTKMGIRVVPAWLFDLQVMAKGERPVLMFLLFIVQRYLAIKATSPNDRIHQFPVRRVCLMANSCGEGGARMASLQGVVQRVAGVVNCDDDVTGFLKMVVVEQPALSVVQMLVPAADLAEHLCLAGSENLSATVIPSVLNGGRLISALDGVTGEIHREASGCAAVFEFGCREAQVEQARAASALQGREMHEVVATCCQAFDTGAFGDECRGVVRELLCNQEGVLSDDSLLLHDFPAYLRAQALADSEFTQPLVWASRSVQAVAGMGRFSSDRTATEYASEVWGLRTVV